MAAVAPPGTTLTWVDSVFLKEAGQDDESLPLWPAADTESDINAGDPARAHAAGLTPRPLADSVTEIHAAEQAAPTPKPDSIGLTPEREADLLTRWAASRPWTAGAERHLLRWVFRLVAVLATVRRCPSAA